MSNIRKRKIGLFFFTLFIICTTGATFAIIFEKKIGSLLSPSGYQVFWVTTFVLILLAAISLILCFIFAKNKIIKIISGSILVFIVFGIFLYSTVLRPHRINGSSMYPNLINGSFVFAEKVSDQFMSPRRGDIVIHSISEYQKGVFINRIVGLPGENISIRGGKVYIDDEPLTEPYLSASVVTESGTSIQNTNTEIPKGQYAVMGDNRGSSLDSRLYGFISGSLISERVFYVYWPSDRAGFVETDKPMFTGDIEIGSDEPALPTPSPFHPFRSCQTLDTKMIVGADGKGQIGCDIKIDGGFDLSRSYCEGQKTHLKMPLIPDSFQRPNQYYTTLTGLDLSEEVKVFIYTQTGSKIECLPSLNRSE